MEKYYITTAIDYVNARPHIGHAYEKIAADILARFHRLLGEDVFFLTGLDEHGSKIEKAAKQAGMEPQQFCDQMAESFRSAWKSLGISYDYFIRTTEKRHTQSVQEIWNRLHSKGDIYKASYKGLYCEGCEDFVRERDLDEEGRCPAHKVKPKEVSEENYFFCLSKYKPAVKEWLLSSPDILRPEGRRQEVLNQLDDPELTDFSVTRSRLSLNWGIPVPNDSNQVIYVWLDALTNYITALGFPGDKDMMSRYWPANLHLIGKDITKFHTIYWPAMLMSADLPLPKQVYGHGFITVEGQKISKSLGNVIDPIALVEEYGSDAVRYSLFACTPFEQDGDFSKEELIRKVNADLANNLGNLLNRSLTLIEKHCQGLVPKAAANEGLIAEAESVKQKASDHIKRLEFAKSLDLVFALVDKTNKYLNDEKPWTLFKNEKQKDAEVVLYTVLEILRCAAILIYPFVPNIANNIWSQLGFEEELEKSATGKIGSAQIPPGQKTKRSGPVFNRIEEKVLSP
jgi:methionyl-tRNA synthetase